MNRYRGDGQGPVVVDEARLDLVNDSLITGIVCMLQAMDSDVDVLAPCSLNVINHFARAFRPIDFQRLMPSEDPRAEDQVWKSERMVGVKVGQENESQIRRGKSWDAAL